MNPAHERILKKMLDRLFAAILNGPSLNCRPHASRQRIDLTRLSNLESTTPENVLKELLSEAGSCKIEARVPAPKSRLPGFEPTADAESKLEEGPEEKESRIAYLGQSSVLKKLFAISEDARTHENDTGVHALHVGFPLLSIPPTSGSTRRILAPLAFLSISLTVRFGAKPAVELECQEAGVDRVVPNSGLLAWLERQTGSPIASLLADEEGKQPWHEIASIAQGVCKQLRIDVPEIFRDPATLPERLRLDPAPSAQADHAEAKILAACVIGLFPVANQALLRDTQEMVASESLNGPILRFLEVNPSLEAPLEARQQQAPVKEARQLSNECLITSADPCQARAVKLARQSEAVVVHGPPGAGKSQTIANMIGDHLARGERVLFVCDKRTALDVVLNRLDALGLGSLCAIVHDPQRDQRDLYKAIREQLDNLTELRTDSAAANNVKRADKELERLHSELSDLYDVLMKKPDALSPSFHELVGK